MRKGLLAEWRRGLASRGLAAALLLAVPVGVAAAIGFEGSLSGLTQGLSSLARGPDRSQTSQGTGSEAIDSALAAIAAAVDEQPSTPAAPPRGGDRTGGAPGAAPGQPGPAGGAGQGPGGGGGGTALVEPPEVELPSDDPGGGGGLLNGIGDTVDGLLDGGL